MIEDRCCYPGCKNDYDVIYLTRQLCDKHWVLIAEDQKGKYKQKIKIVKVDKQWVTAEAARKLTK